MSVELVEKTCAKCKRTLPLSEFYRNRSRSDGRSDRCKDCAKDAVKASKASRRAEMGEEAWLTSRAEAARRSRERSGNQRGRIYDRARRAALQGLIDAHRSEFDRRMALALDELERTS